MNVAGSSSERFFNAAASIKLTEMMTPAPENWQEAPAEPPSPEPETAPPSPSLPPVTPAALPLPSFEHTEQETPDQAPTRGTGTAATTIFRLERDRLASLYDLNWRRIRLLLWILTVGAALGFLLLLPPARSALTPLPAPTPPNSQPFLPPISHPPAQHRPFLSIALFVVGIGGPLLALALALTALPALLWREVWLRRQRDVHLAIGRQGVLFFLPSRPGYWFLLPWGHVTSITDATITPPNGRRARLRTILWRRLALLRRVFRHGRRLGEASSRPRRSARSPFVMHARRQQPRQMLRLTCYAPLPDSGYAWLFRLAPFVRLTGRTSFLLETGWFEPIRAPGSGAGQPPAAGILHRLLLNLWNAPLARAQRPALPLPRSGGAVILNAAPFQGVNIEARRADRAAQAALLLIPALSVSGLIIALVTHQLPARAAVLNAAALVTLMLGLGLLLAGVKRARRGWLFISGAALLALAGLLNLGYGLIAQLADWPWRYQSAPGEPFLFLELLGGLLIAAGALALALEGSGRPGARPAASAGLDTMTGARMGTRPHSAELALTLGLGMLGLARMLEDVDRAILHRSSGTALLDLRAVLAEPLLPLAIILLSYFAPLAGPALQPIFRALQIIYGLSLALLVPGAFVLVQRATHLSGLPLPLPWAPMLALELVCGLAVVVASVWHRKGSSAPAP